jgi:hypothetical protein
MAKIFHQKNQWFCLVRAFYLTRTSHNSTRTHSNLMAENMNSRLKKHPA